jgi:hypothetical protein
VPFWQLAEPVENDIPANSQGREATKSAGGLQLCNVDNHSPSSQRYSRPAWQEAPPSEYIEPLKKHGSFA